MTGAPIDRGEGPAPAKKIRLLLADDHGLFRDGLSRLLEDEPDLEVAAQCSSVEELRLALSASAAAPIDLILLDYDLGESNGFHALAAARALGFAGRVLLVTAGMAAAEMVRAFQQGVSGLFLKHSPPNELVRAIHQVMQGEPWPDRTSFETLLATAEGTARDRDFASNRGFNASGSARPHPLTQRERAVLRGVFEGRLNKEIAGDLGVSEGSVKAVLQQLFSKTGVRSRAQLVRIALENRYEYELDPG
jgi:DNA-binding NarL/FixJ family response regulator